MDREALEKQAKKLNISFTEDTTDDELSALIVDAEKKAEDNNKDKDYWISEAKSAFEARDQAKKDARKLKEKLQELEDQLKTAPNKEEYDELKKSIKDLKTFKEEADKKLEEEELKKKTDIERAEINFSKKMEEFENRMKESLSSKEEELKKVADNLNKKDEVIKNLRKSTLKTQIMEAASRFNAYNPIQIVGLLQSEFNYDENLDKFSKEVKKDGKLIDLVTVEDRVKEFLSDPINDNLVKTKVKTDGLDVNDSKTFNKDKDKDKSQDDETKIYDPNDTDLIARAEEEGFSDVQGYINVLKIKDAKLAKIK